MRELLIRFSEFPEADSKTSHPHTTALLCRKELPPSVPDANSLAHFTAHDLYCLRQAFLTSNEAKAAVSLVASFAKVSGSVTSARLSQSRFSSAASVLDVSESGSIVLISDIPDR